MSRRSVRRAVCALAALASLSIAVPFACVHAADAEPPLDPARGRALMQKSARGEALTAEEQSYLERVKQMIRERNANKRSGAEPGPAGAGGEARAPSPGNPSGSTGLVPLTQMRASYQGEDGGLYGGGGNEPPEAHRAAHLRESGNVRPLDAGGLPSEDGRIGLITIGFSNTSIESEAFRREAGADPQKSPRVVIVNGAIPARLAVDWVRDGPDAQTWQTLARRVAAAGLSPAQVQVCWLKQANRKRGEFPAYARELQADLTAILHIARRHYPNLRVAYLSSRIFGGWPGPGGLEPVSYESAFAVRRVVQSQIDGDARLNFNPVRGEVNAPLVLWGPYLWSQGETPRQLDGLAWPESDFRADRLHPNESGAKKVAALLLKFFKTNEGARLWFLTAGRAER